MRLLHKRALEKSASIKSIEKDTFTGREGKIMEPEKNRNAGTGCIALRNPLNLPLPRLEGPSNSSLSKWLTWKTCRGNF